MRVVVRVVIALVGLTLLATGPVAAGLNTADLSITKAGAPDPVAPGSNLTYTITVQNAGPDDGNTVAWDDTLPPGVTFVSLTAPAGWTLTTPPVGGTGTVTGTIPTLTVAAGAQVFTLVVQVGAGVTNGTLINNVANVTASSIDPNLINNSFITIVQVAAAPVASVPDAAMPEPTGTNPAIPLGFVALLLGGLGAIAVIRGRRSPA